MNNTCNDLTEICNLTEEAIVSTLRSRFLENKIYTRIRNSTLVYINPYQDVSDSQQELSERYLSEYKETSTAIHRSPQQLDPHIFQHVNQAYFHLRRTGNDQSIVFRGATASGKTQMRQAALLHLMTLSSSNNKKIERVQDLVQRAYRVLELFGNCRATANTNASRFGSFVELQFNERGRMIGAKFLDYTLDRSRVTQPQASEETNYNVLYKIAQQQQTSPFLYNREAAARTAADEDQDLMDLKSDMKALGIGKATWQELVNILTAILRIGNIQFSTRQQDVIVKNPNELEAIAQLLGVEPRDIENVLTYQTKLVQREMATVVLTAEQAGVQRDQLAQTLYTLLFSWIVEAINRKLCKSTFQNFIGLLDFPGTSSAQSFDQFCVHFANEKLQQFMLSHQFQYNAGVYAEKPVDRDPVTFSFASGLQITSKLAACTTAEQIEAQLSECKQDPALTIKRSGTFCVQHFSGPVAYNVQEIASKNAETLNADYVALFKSDNCTNELAKQLFSQKVVSESQTKCGTIVSAQQSYKPHRSPSMRKKNKRESTPKQQIQTRFGQVADAIDELITTLQETQLWWVVCLRPNDLNLPKSCDAKKLAGQVQMYQLVDLALRARHEYLVRISIDEFCERYKELIEETSISDYGGQVSPSDQCHALMGVFNWNVRMMVIGYDHVYLDSNAWTILENQLRSAEKQEQRKARSAARGIAFDNDDNNNPPMSPYDVAASVIDGSVFSDEHGRTHCYTDTTTSVRTSSQLASDDTIKIPKEKTVKTKKQRPTAARAFWVTLTWISTWWIPGFVLGCIGGMRRADIRMAWREKFTLCVLIFLLCAAMIWFICFFGQLLCPHEDLYSHSELQARNNKDNAYIAIRGEVFDLTSFAPRHWAPEVIPSSALFQYAGQDVSGLFPVQVSALCDGNNAPIPPELTLETHIDIVDSNAKYHDFRYFQDDYRADWYFEQMMSLRRNYRLGFMGYDMDDIKNQALNPVQLGGISTERRWAVLHGNVYDLTSYMLGGVQLHPRGEPAMPPSNDTAGADFIDNSITELFRQLAGTDVTAHFDALPMDPDKRSRQLTCLRNLFFVGKVDNRRSLKCLFSEYLLLIITAFLCSVILFKFLAALCLVPAKAQDEEFDKFIVCQVPCYTEGEESLRKTIDSVAALKYDDKRKLLFLVADGMVVGSGNDRSTPRIVLDILGVDPSIDPEPVSFLSLGPGQKQHNMAKVYSGLYEHAGHVVPYIVVVKVGTPNERQKSGNRGKRDSQMVLMRFLNKVHYDAPMTPLELVIYHELKNVIGVHPSFYEFVLMVDADTEVMPDALNHMVARFVQDPKIIGLCGETMLSNEKDTWVTMIQVYEYYISHYLSKAFESLFGSVTCLPGCFCMYRIRSTTNRPLLVSHAVINDYAENNVDTLHKKNLLHLGEDRYLTTLILKHFPTYKTKFTPDVACMTNAPDRWPVLLSQRRRWINSTVHNLGELMFLPELCGFCCFSMRFVVMLDLLSTLVMPAVVCYLVYLLYQLSTSTSQVPLISIITLAGVYGLQAIIFILRRKWEHIGWMIVYILAIPVFSFLVPLYAFWHFDDFSWGNTRIVLGDRGQKKAVGPEEGEFDPHSIPTKRWAEHERDMWEHSNADDEKVFRSPRHYASSKYLSTVGNIQLPTESEIAREIERILQEAELSHLTKKQVRDQLSDIFQIDMNYKRAFINKCIESCLQMYK